MPLGPGLYINPENGEFTDIEPSPYIYCVPQYSDLPVTYPPYGCETEVNTEGVTDFTDAWAYCDFSEMPCVDTSSGTLFGYAWSLNYNLTSFPSLDVSQGEDFGGTWSYTGLTTFPKLNFEKATNMGYFPDSYGTWQGCFDLEFFPEIDAKNVINFDSTWYNCYSLAEFPKIDTSSGENFNNAWGWCTSLTSFPLLNVSSGTTFQGSWYGCTNLASFPSGVFDSCLANNYIQAWGNCALSQQSVDNILVSLNTAGQSNGIVNIDGGTSSPPGSAGLAAKASLEGRGWTVTTN